MHIEKQNSQCDERRLRAYLDQDLAATEEVEVEQHLSECSECQRVIRDSAVEPQWWSDASHYLCRDELDDVVSHSSAFSVTESKSDQAGFSRPMVIRQIREWLDPADDPKYIGRFGGYEIMGVVGCGGMGVVLKGFEPSLNRYVAIKVLSPALAASGAARQRFAREAQAAAAVLHENVIAIHRVDESHGLPYLVMPYVSGVSLQGRIGDEGPLPLTAILRIGRQIAAGLAAAHAQGLVHRDIKPANILLDRGVERVTITDFGLARAADDGSLTKTGVIAGTPQYMSPEQSRGQAIDARSDLFSLGSVLYAMCTGHPPYRAETSYGILRRITDEEPRPLRETNPQIPEWFEAIIRRLHAKSPDERFQTAEEVAELLEECLAHVQQPTVVPLPDRISIQKHREISTDRTTKFRKGVLVMIAAFTLVLLGVFLWQSADPPVAAPDQPANGLATESAAPPATERKTEKSPIDKSSLDEVSKQYSHETRVTNGVVTSGGIIERIEGDTIHLTSGDSVVVGREALITMRTRAEPPVSLMLDWLEQGMAVTYSIKDGKVQRVHLVGIVEPEPGGKDVVERIKELKLHKSGQISDSLDGRHPIRVVGSDGEVLVKLGETKLIRMPKPTTSVEWRSGEFAPETIDDVEPFDYVLVHWRANGRITWTFYQLPSKPKQGGGDDLKAHRAESAAAPDATEQDDAVRRETDRLAGVWQLKSLTSNGKELDDRPTGTLTFRGNQVRSTLKNAGSDDDLQETEFRYYSVNPAQSPAEINIYGPNLLVQGIYKLVGDELTLATYGRSEIGRPRSFALADAQRDGQSLTVRTFRRVDLDIRSLGESPTKPDRRESKPDAEVRDPVRQTDAVWLGVGMHGSKRGVDILQVHPETGAQVAGLRVGDRIVALDGRTVSKVQEVVDRTTWRKPGEEATLLIQREDELLAVKVKLTKFKAPADATGHGDAAHREVGRLAGVWKLESWTDNGKERDGGVKSGSLTFRGNRVLIALMNPGSDNAVAEREPRYFSVNPAKSPAEINLYDTNFLVQGIYKLEGDTLTLATFGRSEVGRPRGFTVAEAQPDRETTGALGVLTFRKLKAPRVWQGQGGGGLPPEPDSSKRSAPRQSSDEGADDSFPLGEAPRLLRKLSIDVKGDDVIVACSLDGRLLAVANGNPTRVLQTDGSSRVKNSWQPATVILDAESGKTVASLKLSTDEEDALLAATPTISHFEVTALGFSPDGKLLAVGTSIGQVKLFNAQTGALVQSLDDEQEKRANGESPDGWKQLRRAMGSVRSLAFSPDGSRLAVCGGSFADFAEFFDGTSTLGRKVTGPGRLKVFDITTGSLKHNLAGHSHAEAVAFSHDGGLLASAGQWAGERGDGAGVIVWNHETGETIPIKANGGAHAVALSPDEKMVVIGSRNFDRENDTSTTTIAAVYPASRIFKWQRVIPGVAHPKAFSPDGDSVLVLCPGRSIQILDADTGETRHEIDAAGSDPADSTSAAREWSDLAVASETQHIAVAGNDAMGRAFVEIWSLGAMADRATQAEGTSPAATPAAAAGPPPRAHPVQVRIDAPAGMLVAAADEGGLFDNSHPLKAPARLDLAPSKTYRLKITNIAGREGTELYPSAEIGPTMPRTEAFLAHNAIPVKFTDEDFDQALAGNFLTKVIYLPDPEFPGLASTGVETLVSTRLDPGADPIVEAKRRGSILAVIRLGTKDADPPSATPAAKLPEAQADTRFDITGVVLSDQKKPLAEADVLLLETYIHAEKLHAKTRTDREGKFTLKGVPQEKEKERLWRYTLVVSAPSFASRVVFVPYAQKEPIHFELELSAPAALRGRVVDADGSPVAGAMVWTPPLKQFIGGVHSATTDASGHFQIGDLAPWNSAAEEAARKATGDEGWSGVKYALRVHHPDHGRMAADYAQVPATLLIRFERPMRVSGRVFDRQTGFPVAGATVRAGTVAGATDAEGRYQLIVQPLENLSVHAKKGAAKSQSIALKGMAASAVTLSDLYLRSPRPPREGEPAEGDTKAAAEDNDARLQDGPRKDSFIQARLVANEDRYALDTRLVKELERFLDETRPKPGSGYTSSGTPPPPPAVDLQLELKNVSDVPVRMVFDDEHQSSGFELEMTGPGAVSQIYGYLGPSYGGNINRREVVLAPGETHRIPLTRLMGVCFPPTLTKQGDRFQRRHQACYWTAPGRYSVSGRFWAAVRADASPDDSAAGYSGVVLAEASPVMLDVVEPKPAAM